MKELYDEIGEESFGDVVDLFVEEVAEGVSKLSAADSARQRVQAFHFLKGAALNLGLTEMANICAIGEQRDGAGQDTKDLVAQVTATFPVLTTSLVQNWRKHIAA